MLPLGAKQQAASFAPDRLLQQSEVLIDLAGSRMERGWNAASGHLFNSQIRECRMLGPQIADLGKSCLSKCCDGLRILTLRGHHDGMDANRRRVDGSPIHCTWNRLLLEVG